MEKIIITGGAGFIGSHTAITLAAAGYEPVIIDNFSNAERIVIERLEEVLGQTVRVHEGDITDPVFLKTVFEEEGSIEGVIHFAALKAVGESVEKPLAYYKNNVGGLITFLEAVLAAGVSRVIFSSSATVYGMPDQNPIPETAPRKAPTSPYGSTKVIGEDILEALVHSRRGLRAVSLRYFNPIGAHPSGLLGEEPRGVPSNLVPYVLGATIGTLPPVTIFGNDYDTPDGTAIRDYLHVMDLAEAHVAALDYVSRSAGPAYDVFNVGTGRGTSVLELINTFEAVTGKPVPHQFGARRPGDIPVCYADPSKMNRLLGYTANRTVSEALKDAWHYTEKRG